MIDGNMRAMIVCGMSVGMIGLVGVGCRDTMGHKVIEFVVPAGFKGPFVIIEGPDGQSCDRKDGKITFIVPESRIVVVRNDGVFDSFRLEARYADGTPLAVEYEAKATTLALRFGGHSSQLGVKPHHECFVGSEDEWAKCDWSELLRGISRSTDD